LQRYVLEEGCEVTGSFGKQSFPKRSYLQIKENS